jgi:hypothetical protein
VPAHLSVPPPPAQLRKAVEAARPCDLAWNRSLRQIDRPVRYRTRCAWRAATVATRSEWDAAYDGEPTAFAMAASALLAADDESRPATRAGELGPVVGVTL